MNRLIIGIATFMLSVSFTSGMLRAQSGDRASIEKQIVANERAIVQAFAKNDPKTFHAYVLPDSFGVDGGGIMKVSEMDKAMSQLKLTSSNIDMSQFYWVNDSTVVHMYRWTGRGTYEGQPVPSPVWASSVWTNKAGKWVGAFHQESVAMPAPPAERRGRK